MTRDQLFGLAQLGAVARLEAIGAEVRLLVETFPTLTPEPDLDTVMKRVRRDLKQRKQNGSSTAKQAAPKHPANGTHKRRPMTPAERKAVGVRMRRYWRQRRKEGN